MYVMRNCEDKSLLFFPAFSFFSMMCLWNKLMVEIALQKDFSIDYIIIHVPDLRLNL